MTDRRERIRRWALGPLAADRSLRQELVAGSDRCGQRLELWPAWVKWPQTSPPAEWALWEACSNHRLTTADQVDQRPLTCSYRHPARLTG